jgi:hypothetical protein
MSYVDSTAGEIAGNALINKFDTVFRNSGLPSDAEVFRGGNDENRVIYFSPKASDIARDLISKFSSQPCAEKPDLSGFSKIKL